MEPARTRILNQQRSWAAARAIAVDTSGYAHALEDNLFQPLNAATRAEFSSGSGDELGSEGRRGKMQALHSSSALACNVFDYWRTRDPSALSQALDLGSTITALRFEAQFPTGLEGAPPNLDLALRLDSGVIAAIESKFTEPFGGSKRGQPFKPKYFPPTRELWRERGLVACQTLASELQHKPSQFKHLNAAQLLKHVLGLAQPSGNEFVLIYLWYAIPSPESRVHAAEVDSFAAAIAGEVRFYSRTYQDLFDRFTRALQPQHSPYLDYLRVRYFDADAT